MLNIKNAIMLVNKISGFNKITNESDLIEITPSDQTIGQKYQIFKEIISCQSYLYINAKMVQLTNILGGFGIISIVDFENIETNYLIYSVICGSGILNCKIVSFDLKTFEEQIIYSYDNAMTTALAIFKIKNSIEIYEVAIKNLNRKLYFDINGLPLIKYAKIKFVHNSPQIELIC